MKKYLLLLSLLCCLQSCNWVYSPPRRNDFEIAKRITDRNMYELEKMGFIEVSTVGPGCCTISLIEACVRSDQYKLQSVDEARSFIVKIIHKFIESYNNEKQIRMYLQNYPLTAKNFQLSFMFYDPITKDFLKPPFIASIMLYNGKLRYFEERGNLFSKLIFEESFDEAQKIVRMERR